MALGLPKFGVMRTLTRDGELLFATRFLRLFAYGFLSVVLVLYLEQLGLTPMQQGLVLTLTLVGDMFISLWLTTRADRIGRRRMLIIGAVLMVFAGLVFAFTGNLLMLIIAGTIGVISPSGNEIGPFLSIEQASLSHMVAGEDRTGIFAWYALAGSLATATGSLCGGWLTQFLQQGTMTAVNSYRVVVIGYALFGIVMAVMFTRLSSAIEVKASTDTARLTQSWLGLHESRKVILKLSSFFALDAFGGGFVIQALMVAYFHRKYGMNEGTLGTVFFAANVLAGISAMSASWMAKRFGLINTMVFTHLPSNVLLIMVPLMPNWWLAITVLLMRFAISQMDVPTRQSYTMAVVKPDERSAAAGVTGVARSVGASVSPLFVPTFLASTSAVVMSMPFFLAGGLKIVYDLLLYRSFVKVRPPEEVGK
jgi:MFS family permease